MKYSVGDLTIDTGRQLVGRGASTIALPKLSYDLLLALVQAAPDLLSADELMRRVWPGIIVSPETVSQRVKMLRDALDDDPRAPRYIQGLRGRGYQILPAVAEAGDGSGVRPATAVSPNSVAVLPFVDMSEKQDQEYFADGLAEELINRLTKIGDLRVTARTSSFYFKGKSEDVPTIARRLMVAHVLEGSVRKSADRLRVTAQLIQADNGYHLWSETYDRQFDDVFQVQDDIAAAVVRSLRVQLLDRSAVQSAPTADSEAYALFLQAELLGRSRASRDSLRAHGYLQQALRLDPGFARAWSALAELYTNDGVEWSEVFPPEHGAGQVADLATQRFLLGTNRVSLAAHEAAQRALVLNGKDAEIHRAMARILWWFDFDWNGAAAENQKARELDPANARVIEQSAQLAISMGRLDEGLALATHAAMLDPLGMVYWEIGGANHRLGQLEAAADAYRRLIELYPGRAGVYFRYGLVLLSQDQPQAALEQFEQEEPWYRSTGMALALDRLGRRADADHALAMAERNWGSGMAYQISYVHAARGDQDGALAWLERAYRQRDAGLLVIAHDPMLASLADNAGFKSFLGKLKLLAE
jgi:TolB-like protein